jgi:hypothetical protein
MYVTRTSLPLGWVACGRGLRRASSGRHRRALAAEYDLSMSSSDDTTDDPVRPPSRTATRRPTHRGDTESVTSR